MTPKEKAIELVNKYLQIYDGRVIQAKQCAIILLEEILDESLQIFRICGQDKDEDCAMVVEYWQEVKQEIENL